jgi:hypothetical protein
MSQSDNTLVGSDEFFAQDTLTGCKKSDPDSNGDIPFVEKVREIITADDYLKFEQLLGTGLAVDTILSPETGYLQHVTGATYTPLLFAAFSNSVKIVEGCRAKARSPKPGNRTWIYSLPYCGIIW